MSKYSIILPVYNGGEYVKQCISSICNQTLQDFNLLILDNNSTDGTVEWIKSLNEPRISVYTSQTNLGITGNWARVKDVTKNEFITLIGHDDILCPNYLADMSTLIAEHPKASLYQCHFEFIDADGNRMRKCKPMAEKQMGHEFLQAQFMHSLDSTGTGYMMRSADFDMLGGMPIEYPNLIFADYHLWLQLTLKSYKATSAAIGFQYRLHNSTSRLTNGELYQQAFQQYVYFISSLDKQYADVSRVVKEYGGNYLMFFCRSLSHRILKTPSHLRKIKVSQFIDKCRSYANLWIPGQPFEPMKKWEINIASKIDGFAPARKLFLLYKSISGRF